MDSSDGSERGAQTGQSSAAGGSRTGDTPPIEMDEGMRVGFISSEEFEDRVHMETHRREHTRDRSHVDLSKEEYTADEIARMIGTSRDVVMHAIWSGELKAERQGQNVVCITHSDVVDWLRRRGPGV